MTLLQASSGSGWVDLTEQLTGLRWSIGGRELESLRFSLHSESVDVGQRVRLVIAGETRFEGVVYEVEKRHGPGDVSRVEALAYTDLIQYDRSIVYRQYPAGTRAGSIIKDLASLVPGVDTENVDEDETPTLNSVWTIQNVEALKVMLDVARGTNYYIRMKPSKKLYFKPKTPGSHRATITSANTVSASYREDRWRLRNRIIYVGAENRVLADISEPPGDLPLIIHDPFLAEEAEAQRRAQLRLALCREYGRSLEVELHKDVFEQMNVELFDKLRVNLPSLGLNDADLPVTGVEYEPESLRYRLSLSGSLESLEDYLQEQIAGDVAARFGRTLTAPEILSTAIHTTEAGLRVQAEPRHVVYFNKPPLTLWDAVNVILNSDGHATLVSGATSGSFEASILPGSSLFTAFVKCEWIAVGNQGRVGAQVLTAAGEEIARVHDAVDTQFILIPRWPTGFGSLTHMSASSWGASGASITNVRAGLLNAYCLRLSPSNPGTEGEIFYPSGKNLGLNIGFAKYIRLYLYGDHASDFQIRVRLWQDTSNYLEGRIIVKRDKWMRYEAVLSTFSKVGSPSIMNWLSIFSPHRLLIDSDYVLLPLTRETLRLKFTLGRDSPELESPVVKLLKMVWREGDYG